MPEHDFGRLDNTTTPATKRSLVNLVYGGHPRLHPSVRGSLISRRLIYANNHPTDLGRQYADYLVKHGDLDAG